MSHIRLSLTKCALSAVALTAAMAGGAMARDQIQVSGSSTVLPYSSIVAEAFGENFSFPTPVVESGGSSGGLKKFCEGVGETTIDIANASRPIRSSELEACKKAGVTDIIEVRFGYDGIVFASDINGNSFAFTPEDWYKALAEQVVVDGKLVKNTVATWDQVRADLPKQKILAFVPGTKHGTREVFEEKVIIAGCKASGAQEALKGLVADEKAVATACSKLRTDGASVDIDGDYTETLARIASDKQGLGVFGLSFYENNADKLKVATVNGVVPTVEAIADGTYPVSRPLFFYVKKAHIGVIPGLQEFVEFFVSDEVAGPGGPLAQYGLVPDPKLSDVQAAVASGATLPLQ